MSTGAWQKQMQILFEATHYQSRSQWIPTDKVSGKQLFDKNNWIEGKTQHCRAETEVPTDSIDRFVRIFRYQNDHTDCKITMLSMLKEIKDVWNIFRNKKL